MENIKKIGTGIIILVLVLIVLIIGITKFNIGISVIRPELEGTTDATIYKTGYLGSPLFYSTMQVGVDNYILESEGKDFLRINTSTTRILWDEVVTLKESANTDKVRTNFRPSVVAANDKYHLFFEYSNEVAGTDGLVNDADLKVFKFTSTSDDLVGWETAKKVTDFQASGPAVIYDGEKFFMFYYREDTKEKVVFLATSTDGETFTVQNDGKPIVSNSPYFDVAWLPNYNLFLMVSASQDATNRQIKYFFSPDGINWGKAEDYKNNTIPVPTNYNLLGSLSLVRDQFGYIYSNAPEVTFYAKDTSNSDKVAIYSLNAKFADVTDNSIFAQINNFENENETLLIIAIIIAILLLASPFILKQIKYYRLKRY